LPARRDPTLLTLNVRAAGLFLAALFVGACGGGGSVGDGARPPLKWGADAEGGAPFVEADPADPSKMRGFDVEVAQMIAAGLGREPQFVQVAWPQIESSVERGDFDVGLSGFEDRPELRARRALSIPYFEFREVIAVRTADSARYRTMADLAGKRVGTLAATLAWEILLAEQKKTGLVPVSYDIDTHPYTDLVAGRIDAVLLDHIIAQRSVKRVGGIVIQPGAVATSHYVAVFASGRTALRDSADVILRARMRDGSLERTYRNWNIWDETQAAHFARVLAAPGSSPDSASNGATRAQALSAYIPSLLQAAGVTLAISVLAMAIAVMLGIAIASGRVYGGTITRVVLTVYVEVMRGTPVLLQLFVIYYGLAAVIKLPAFAAAVIGLGLNYAAYESEIYRAALEAVPRAQLEAARTLGFSEVLTLRLIRGPQALRLALAPMTNDFVALLKDSSLVSVITVIELTKASSIYAVNVGSWLVPGILCAAVYLMMSLPLSRLARNLEKKWRVT
jgi:polar amino acid transport system substrate-binding protein